MEYAEFSSYSEDFFVLENKMKSVLIKDVREKSAKVTHHEKCTSGDKMDLLREGCSSMDIGDKVESHLRPEFLRWNKEADKGKIQLVNKDNKESQVLFLTAALQRGWFVDSGATCHIVNDKGFFSDFDESYSEDVFVANGGILTAHGKGSGSLGVIGENNVESTIQITEVLFVPSMEGNLLSVRRLAEKGFEVNFKTEICEIKLNGKKLAVADACSTLYKLRQSNKVFPHINQHKENCVHYWHRVLGHRDPEVVKSLNSSIVDGVELVDCRVKCLCTICKEIKGTRLPLSKIKVTAEVFLDIVHMDCCGPMENVSPDGKKYILTFVDDLSRYSVVYLLQEKSEIFGKVKEYNEMVKRKFSRHVKVIRSDRGGEFISVKDVQWLKLNGVQVKVTTHQGEGVGELRNRLLIDMARCMLLEANLGYRFWAEAVMTANFMQNRLPADFVKVTPYEYWNGSKPNLRNLRMFGSKCFVNGESEKLRKLDESVSSMIFIGYDEEFKKYRCWDPDSSEVVISGDVVFEDCQQEEDEKFKDSSTVIGCNGKFEECHQRKVSSHDGKFEKIHDGRLNVSSKEVDSLFSMDFGESRSDLSDTGSDLVLNGEIRSCFSSNDDKEERRIVSVPDVKVFAEVLVGELLSDAKEKLDLVNCGKFGELKNCLSCFRGNLDEISVVSKGEVKHPVEVEISCSSDLSDGISYYEFGETGGFNVNQRKDLLRRSFIGYQKSGQFWNEVNSSVGIGMFILLYQLRKISIWISSIGIFILVYDELVKFHLKSQCGLQLSN